MSAYNSAVSWKSLFKLTQTEPGICWKECESVRVTELSYNHFVFGKGDLLLRQTAGVVSAIDVSSWGPLWMSGSVVSQYLLDSCGTDVYCAKMNGNWHFFNLISGAEIFPRTPTAFTLNNMVNGKFYGKDYFLTGIKYNLSATQNSTFALQLSTFHRTSPSPSSSSVCDYTTSRILICKSRSYGANARIRGFGMNKKYIWCCTMDATGINQQPEILLFSMHNERLVWSVPLPVNLSGRLCDSCYFESTETHLVCAFESRNLFVLSLSDGSVASHLKLASTEAPVWIAEGRLLVQNRSGRVRVCSLEWKTGQLTIGTLIRVKKNARIIPVCSTAFLALSSCQLRLYDVVAKRRVWLHQDDYFWWNPPPQMDSQMRWLRFGTTIVRPTEGTDMWDVFKEQEG